METNIKMMPLKELLVNQGQIEGLPANPRTIKNKDFKRLVNSILVFPGMLYLRPITVVGTTVVGGNHRKDALSFIFNKGIDWVGATLMESDEFNLKPEYDQEKTMDHWQKFFGTEKVPTQDASDLSIDEIQEFVVKDNVGFGQDDLESFNTEWDKEKIKAWGVDFPKDWGKVKEETPSGENTTPFHQMTFTLSDVQVELVKKMLSGAKKKTAFKETNFDNTNANANALYFLLNEAYLKSFKKD